MARLRTANPFPAIVSLAVALLPVACGPGGSGGSADTVPGVSSIDGALPTPRDPRERILAGLRLLVRARGELEVVRRALADGATERAGASLDRTIRDLEEGMAIAGARLTPDGAAEFERARRSADRWRAGEALPEGTAERIVRSMEDESEALARALGPR